MIVATCACKYLYLHERFGVAVMGRVSAGMPAPQVPLLNLQVLQSGMLVDSLVLAVVCFAIAFSMGKIFMKKFGYQVHANQELLAQGSANVFASFFSCFPATASLSRTAVMGEYAISHVASLVSCLILLLFLLFFAPALAHLPKCVVAVIIIVAQKSLMMQARDVRKFCKVSRWEGVSALTTPTSRLPLTCYLCLALLSRWSGS